MQIEKKQNRSTPASSAATHCAMKVAHAYAATFPASLALARWVQGGDIPHTPVAADDAPARAAWFARAQADFQHWLEAGGFHGGAAADDADGASCEWPAPSGGANRPRPLAFGIDAGPVAQAIVIPGRTRGADDAPAAPAFGIWPLDAGYGDALRHD